MKYSFRNGEEEIITNLDKNFAIVKIIDSGFGLILNEQLVNLNNCSIKINSSCHIGSTVIVKLPL